MLNFYMVAKNSIMQKLDFEIRTYFADDTPEFVRNVKRELSKAVWAAIILWLMGDIAYSHFMGRTEHLHSQCVNVQTIHELLIWMFDLPRETEFNVEDKELRIWGEKINLQIESI